MSKIAAASLFNSALQFFFPIKIAVFLTLNTKLLIFFIAIIFSSYRFDYCRAAPASNRVVPTDNNNGNADYSLLDSESGSQRDSLNSNFKIFSPGKFVGKVEQKFKAHVAILTIFLTNSGYWRSIFGKILRNFIVF